MTIKNLSIKFPDRFIESLNRRHNGNQEISNEDRAKGWYVMEKLYDKYNEYIKKENHLLEVEWDELRVEENYCNKIFINAHRRLKSYRTILNEIHKAMFYLLLKFDGNYELFDSGSLSVDEIYYSFKDKYVDRIKINAEEWKE